MDTVLVCWVMGVVCCVLAVLCDDCSALTANP